MDEELVREIISGISFLLDPRRIEGEINEQARVSATTHPILLVYSEAPLIVHRRKIVHLGDAISRQAWQSTGTMADMKIKREQRRKTGSEPRTEPPWNVVLHNDWDNSMPHVVLILKKVIPGMTYKKAAKVMWEAHTRGKATVKRCHKELAELYGEQLRGEGLSVSLEPASSG